MKPYQSALEVAYYIKKYKNKPVSIEAITEYFKAGLKRELENIATYNYQWEVWEDIHDWMHELESWLMCWYNWIYAY